MNVNPSSAAPAPAAVQAVNKLAAARKAYGAPPAETVRPRAADRLELSGASHLLQLAKSSDVRTEKVQMLKDQIDSGTYDLDAKAEVVADRLLDDLGVE